MSMFAPVAEGIYVMERPQRFMGMELGTRMTALSLDGGVLVYSPLGIDPAQASALGDPKWVLAPNLLHHLYVGPWIEAGWEAWAAPGLEDKRTDLHFQGSIMSSSHPFGDELQVLPMSCFPMTNEVAVLHRPSRTLIVCDLVFHIQPTAHWWTRTVMRCLCGYPGCETTLLERWGMHRQRARQELKELLSWDFDRLIMAHGKIVETDGKAALKHAFRWLDKSLRRPTPS